MDYLLQLPLKTLTLLIVVSSFYKVKGQTYNRDSRSFLRYRQLYQDQGYRLSDSYQGYRQTQPVQRYRQTQTHKGPRQTQTNQGQRGSYSRNDYEATGRSQPDSPHKRPTGTQSSHTRRPFSSILHSIYENAMPGMDSLTTTRVPGMTVEEMESILKRIRPHLGPKDKNTLQDLNIGLWKWGTLRLFLRYAKLTRFCAGTCKAKVLLPCIDTSDYTGSRMMLLILTEQCRRLVNSRSPRTRQFCFEINNSFPTS